MLIAEIPPTGINILKKKIMKKLKSITDFAKNQKDDSLNLSAIYGGKIAPDYTMTQCVDTASTETSDCSDKDQ